MTGNDKQLAAALRALADPARLRLLRLILRGRSGLDPRCALHAGVCFCHLSEALDLAPATVSHHLKVLRQAGFIEGVRVGRWTHYRVCEHQVSTLMHSLSGLLDHSQSGDSAGVATARSPSSKRTSAQG